MLFKLPKWLLLALGLAGVGAALLLLYVQKPRLPEDCLTANAAMEAGDYNLAIDHYLMCIETGELPDTALAAVYFVMGDAYSAKGNRYQAIQDYGEAIRLDPGHAWAHNNRCWNYALLRQASEALQDCDEALRLLPDQPEILDSRALAYWLLDDREKARRDLERARQLDPSLPDWQERFRDFEGMF